MSDTTPRNVVDDPILNNPFEAPRRYYDFSGPAPRPLDGRRAAGYHGTARTERMGEGPIAAHEFFPLPTVNEIRGRVGQWRERGYPGVTPITRDLLEHWNRPDRRPLFFCQREAAETVIWLTEASAADRQGVDVPADEPNPGPPRAAWGEWGGNDLESLRKSYGPLRRYCAKMATGSGKTTVMAMVAAWSIINKIASRQDARFSDAVLVVCPNLTIKERLAVLKPQIAGNYYEAFDLVPASYRDMLARGRVFATNWHVFAVQDDAGRRGIVQRGRESDAAFVRARIDKELGNAKQILVLNDEAHHAYRPASPEEREREKEGLTASERDEVDELADEATVWVGGLDRINKVRGIRLVFDVSATPFYLRGSGHPEGSPLPWIVSDFGIVDAIESGITKVPRIPVADDAGRPDPKYFHLWRQIMAKLPQSDRETNKRAAKPEAVWKRAEGALATLADKWKATLEHFEASRYPVPPALIVVAANTKLASVIADALRRGDVTADLAGDATFAIDSKVLAEAESASEGGTKDDAKELLRLKTSTVGKARWPDRPPAGFEDMPEPPGKNVRCVVSVGMLTEGWDAQNVTQILGLRAFSSQLLCEQVVGRGLRRMSYDMNPDTGLLEPEYCDVFGIPFEVIPVQGSKPRAAQPLPPSTLVRALEERHELAIEFPRVEGYVLDVRERIRCDVRALPRLRIEPQIEPTAVVVWTQMGWTVGKQGLGGGAQTLTRERFYDEHRLQKTAFGIARDVTEVLAGGSVSIGREPSPPKMHSQRARLLFPQVLGIVQRYLDERLEVAPNAAVEEVALAIYRDVVVERVLAGIEPDAGAGEAPLLPRIERHRPIGTTAQVQFRTTKKTVPTLKSQISHVVLDSTFEGSAAFHLEQLARQGIVRAYAKNDRLDFEIEYEHQDKRHRYRPDFLVRVDLGDGADATLILEMKGFEDAQDRAKRVMAQKWVRAVNHHGGFGRWDFVVCKDPNLLPSALTEWRASALASPTSRRSWAAAARP